MAGSRKTVGNRYPGAAGTSGPPGTTNAKRVREANITAVLRHVVGNGPVSRTDLAEHLGISPATATRLVAALVEAGLVREVGTAPSRGGRRRRLVEYDPAAGNVLGVDIGGSKVAVTLADLAGREVASTQFRTRPEEGDVLQRIADGIEQFLRETGIPRQRLKACGVAAPGVVDDQGRVFFSPNLGWDGVPVRDELAGRLRVPVLVDNDCNLAALAESRARVQGGTGPVRNLVFVALGTGLGAGVVLDGRLFRGSHFMAGEIGYWMLGPEWLDGEYFGHGCLEWMTSGEAAGRAARQVLAASGGRFSAAGEGPPSAESLTSAAVYEAASRGVPWAVEATEGIARALGVALGNVACLLDPDVIVIGGGILKAGAWMLRRVEATMARFVPRAVPVQPSLLGERAQVTGAVCLALDHVLDTLFVEGGSYDAR